MVELELQPLSALLGVIEGEGDVVKTPFDGLIAGEWQRVTAVLERTVVYELGDDRLLARFPLVMVESTAIVFLPKKGRPKWTDNLRRPSRRRPIEAPTTDGSDPVCLDCGKPILSPRGGRFCNYVCNNRYARAVGGRFIAETRSCRVCGKSFEARWPDAAYCGLPCRRVQERRRRQERRRDAIAKGLETIERGS